MVFYGRREEKTVTATGFGVSFWDDENLLELVVISTQLCEYTKKSQNSIFKKDELDDNRMCQ